MFTLGKPLGNLQSDSKRKCITSLSGRPQGRKMDSQSVTIQQRILKIVKDELDWIGSCLKDAKGKAFSADLGSSGNDCRCKRSPHQQCSPLGTHHLRWSGPIWSHLVPSGPSESPLKSPAFAQVLAFREMPKTSSQALNPCDGYRQHTCQLLSSMVPNGFNMFQCVPINYLPIKHDKHGGFPIYINTVNTDLFTVRHLWISHGHLWWSFGVAEPILSSCSEELQWTLHDLPGEQPTEQS